MTTSHEPDAVRADAARPVLPAEVLRARLAALLADFPARPLAFPPLKMAAACVPWPVDARRTRLNPPPGTLRFLAVHRMPLIRLAFTLFYMPPATGAAYLHLALLAAREVVVADFKPAERNLEMPACLLARCLPGLWPWNAVSGAFLRNGGAEGLAAKVGERAGAQVTERRVLLGGAAVLLRLRAE